MLYSRKPAKKQGSTVSQSYTVTPAAMRLGQMVRVGTHHYGPNNVSGTQKIPEAPHPDLESMRLNKVEEVATSQSQASDLLVPMGQSGELH